MEAIQEALSILDGLKRDLFKALDSGYQHFSNPSVAQLPDYPYDRCKLVWHDYGCLTIFGRSAPHVWSPWLETLFRKRPYRICLACGERRATNLRVDNSQGNGGKDAPG